MHQVFMKVYGAFHPVSETVASALETLQPQIIGEGEWLFHSNDMLTLSYEGIWFPADEALQILTNVLPRGATGKLDILDMDAWTLTRHQWQDGRFHSSPSRDLNSVLDHSGF